MATNVPTPDVTLPPDLQGGGLSTSSGGVFNPGAVAAAATTDPNADYQIDAFGMPKWMGKMPTYTGYAMSVPNPEHPVGPSGTSTRTNKFKTVTELMQEYSDLSRSGKKSDRLAWEQLQIQLQAMGAYGDSKRINFGGPMNAQDQNALQWAFQGYLGSGTAGKLMTFTEYVQAGSASGANNNLDKTQPTITPGPTFTDPARVAMTGDQAAQNELGRSLNAGQQATFQGQIHGAEQGQFDAAAAGQGNTNPDVAALARQFVVDNNLPEYAQHQVQSYMNVFANAFLTGQSSRANTGLGDVAIGG